MLRPLAASPAALTATPVFEELLPRPLSILPRLPFETNPRSPILIPSPAECVRSCFAAVRRTARGASARGSANRRETDTTNRTMEEFSLFPRGALAQRPEPKNEAEAGLAFITQRGFG